MRGFFLCVRNVLINTHTRTKKRVKNVLYNADIDGVYVYKYKVSMSSGGLTENLRFYLVL